MIEENIILDKKIKDIEIKMIRKKQDVYIKIIPTTQKSNPIIFMIIINGEKYNFDIYDKNGRESHKIYIKSKKITPCFYLINEKFYFEIICEINQIIALKKHNNKSYFNNINDSNSENITCWAVNIYITSRKEKKPFCDM